MEDSTKVYLQFSDGLYDLMANYQIKIVDIKPSMPVIKNEFSSFSGSIGQRLVSHTFDSFTLNFEFDFFTSSLNDLILVETELRELFTREPEYYFLYSREPGKRYPVTLDSITATKKAFYKGNFSVLFKVYRGYSESLISTLSDFSLDYDWQFSQGLISEDYKYKHKTSNFIIYNAGSLEIDPREHYLKIKVEGESEGNVTIFNKTTGDRFIYYPPLSTNRGQTLVLDGVFPKLNGVKCGIDTNHGLINLVEGVNEIEIQNITRVKSLWDFCFLYK
ncbi:phage tail domain-containing protein [Enterococcus faecium]